MTTDFSNALVDNNSSGEMIGFMQTTDEGTTTHAALNLNYGFYNDQYVPWYTNYYHTYPVYINEDKYGKAFRIAKMLLAKGLLSSKKLVDVMKLIELVAAEL